MERNQNSFLGREITAALLFTWITPILNYAFATDSLQLDILPTLPLSFTSIHCLSRFLKAFNGKGFFTNEVTWLNKDVNSSKSYIFEANSFPLLLVILKCHGLTIFQIFVLKMVSCVISFTGPILLGLMVSYLSNEDSISSDSIISLAINGRNLSTGLFLAVLIGLNSILQALVNVNCNARCLDIKLKLQSALTQLVAARSLSLPQRAWCDLSISQSQLLTFLQVDIEQVSGFAQTVNEVWALPVQIAVAFALLYLQVRVAFLAGVAVIVVMIPLNSIVAKRIGTSTQELLKHKDSRLRLLQEALAGIMALKMSALEETILLASGKSRQSELQFLAIRKYLDAICVFLWAATPVLVPFATFSTAVILAVPLTSAKVITGLALLNMLIFPMNALPWVINGFMEARVSLRRMAKILNDGKNSNLALISNFERPQNVRSPLSPKVGPPSAEIILDADQYSWVNPISTAVLKDAKLCVDESRSVTSMLIGLSKPLVLKSGEIWCIIGSTGSGKSGLLLSMLNELQPMPIPASKLSLERLLELRDVDNRQSHLSENDHLSYSSLSYVSLAQGDAITMLSSNVRVDNMLPRTGYSAVYCSQLPEIFNGSVRDNITMRFERHYTLNSEEETRYQSILVGLGINIDLQSFPEGDRTSVGSEGCRLSGGQRLRIGIARAIYRVLEICLEYHSPCLLILDDPFSALDMRTAMLTMRFLCDDVAGGKQVIGEDSDSKLSVGSFRPCILLAANNLSLLANDSVSGLLLLRDGQEVDRGSYSHIKERAAELFPQDDASVSGGSLDSTSTNLVEPSSIGKAAATSDAIASPVSGTVSFKVYKAYFIAAGPGLCVIVFFSTLIMSASRQAMSIYLGTWASKPSSSNRFLLVAGTIAAINAVFTFIRAFAFALAGMRACKNLYSNLSMAIFAAPLDFFEFTADPGDVINRLGRDTNTIDDQLPFTLNSLLAQAFSLLGALAVVALCAPLSLVFLALVAILYYRLQRFYRVAARELRRIDSEQRSPVYACLGDCARGSASTRSLGDKAIHSLRLKLANELDSSIRVSLIQGLASQWMSIRVQLLGAFVTAALSILLVLLSGPATVMRVGDSWSVSPGIAGLALIMCTSVVNNLGGFISALSETEQEMIAVERVLQYTEVEPEEEKKLQNTAIQGSSIYSFLYKYICFNSKEGRTLSTVEEPLLASSAEGDDDDIEEKLSNDQTPSLGLQIVGLSLRYPGSSIDTLSNINFTLEPGDKLLICGRTGCGKSTLLRAILGLSRPLTGSRILFRGNATNGHSLRGATVPQRPLLFSGTLRFNLDPKSQFRDALLQEKLLAVGFTETVDESSLDKDNQLLDMELLDGGSNLSLGQRQLICLARAFLEMEFSSSQSFAKLLVLDELSASLDAATASTVVASLSTHLQANPNDILVAVTHNPTQMEGLCNKVLKLDAGKIVYFGPYNDLLFK